jgi:hypothetical protein
MSSQNVSDAESSSEHEESVEEEQDADPFIEREFADLPTLKREVRKWCMSEVQH